MLTLPWHGGGRKGASHRTATALEVHDLLGTTEKVLDVTARHYTGQVLRQLHRLVGSVDLLGNPAGLFGALSSGVQDFFYEPYQGLARGTAHCRPRRGA